MATHGNSKESIKNSIYDCARMIADFNAVGLRLLANDARKLLHRILDRYQFGEYAKVDFKTVKHESGSYYLTTVNIKFGDSLTVTDIVNSKDPECLDIINFNGVSKEPSDLFAASLMFVQPKDVPKFLEEFVKRNL